MTRARHKTSAHLIVTCSPSDAYGVIKAAVGEETRDVALGAPSCRRVEEAGGGGGGGRPRLTPQRVLQGFSVSVYVLIVAQIAGNSSVVPTRGLFPPALATEVDTESQAGSLLRGSRQSTARPVQPWKASVLRSACMGFRIP
ncbi:hypothetical protein EYF80_051803 [Liparis tanakae]|uniref:Uncharacterized protein n=1 Tax=Liparis tanakae TaxID=230148 RepID=A0A4Z2F9W2_9TELE|nr:hypothetical protein EYF80_051803 [Liparis tanakae]